MAVERPLKGVPADGTVVVRVPGGVRPDGLALAIAGAPSFRPGDEVLLFLTPRSDGFAVLQQLFLGAFRIAERGGREIAIRDPSPALPLAGVHRFDAAPRDLHAFRRWLGDRARGTIRPADYFIDDGQPAASKSRGKHALIVSSTEPPPVGCGANGGHPVRWPDFDDGLAVAWRSHFSGQSGVPGGGAADLERALAAWSDDPNSAVDLIYSGLTAASGGLAVNDGVNAVLYGDPADAIPGSFEGAGILAVGGPWFSCDLMDHRGERYHPIVEGDIVTQDGLERFFAASDRPRQAAEELFAHEIGHTLGFAHTGDAEALMHAGIRDDGRGAALEVDDLAGLDALYGFGGLAPPAAPGALSAVAETASRVRLTWADASDDESNFRLERRETGDFVPIAAVAADRTGFVDARLRPETAYTYRLRAQNGAGASPYSGDAAVTTPVDPRPAAPSNLRAAPISSRRVRLTWQDNSDDETSFVLEIRDPETSSFVVIPYPVPAGTTTLLVSELEAATVYGFRVRSRNAFGASAASNQVAVATFAEGAACETTTTALCLLGGRFRVELFYVDPRRDGERQATAVPSTDEIGHFWFFGPENIELIVKMLDGRALNRHFWVFSGGVSDLELRLEITDTTDGRTITYPSPRGEICGTADIEAFDAGELGDEISSAAAKGLAPVSTAVSAGFLLDPVPGGPKDAAGSCVPGPDNLCLLNRRLRVEARWRNPYGGGAEGIGRAVFAGDHSGYFWFFGAQNTELVVKTLDGGAVNGHLWVFYGALSDLEYWITLTDTFTDTRRVYYNPPGKICGRADTEAFPTTPPRP